MSGPIAAYSYPPVKTEEQPVREDATGEPDVDMRIALARQEEKVEGLKQTVEREFARMAEALGKHADAVNNAFSAMKNDFVTKGDYSLLESRFARIEKIVLGACGLILTAVIVALIALVLVKP
jgi:hypothetical protein